MRARTEIQQKILDILRTSDAPMTAYDVLAALRDGAPKMAPPTVYRALNQLIAAHCVHRLESINAYAVCKHEPHLSAPVFSICDDCGAADEHVDASTIDALRALTTRTGFAAERQVIEVHGQCADCRDETSTRPTGADR